MKRFLTPVVGLAAVSVSLAISPSNAAQTAYLLFEANGSHVAGILQCPASPVGKNQSWVRDNCKMSRSLSAGADTYKYRRVKVSSDGIVAEIRVEPSGSRTIETMFNPKEIRVDQSVPQRN